MFCLYKDVKVLFSKSTFGDPVNKSNCQIESKINMVNVTGFINTD